MRRSENRRRRDEGPGGDPAASTPGPGSAPVPPRARRFSEDSHRRRRLSIREEVRLLAEVGREAEPLSGEEEERLLALFRPYARRLAFYRGVV